MRERNELLHGTDSPRAVRGALGSRYAGTLLGALLGVHDETCRAW